MNLITRPDKFRELMLSWRCDGKTTALVPTMGYFHEGHLSLMRWARDNADRVAVSLFVNPSQFGPGEDLSAYPRDLAHDRAMAEAEGADVLFCPEAADMYPEGFATWVEVPDLGRALCGRSRPGHFRGVATIVSKLLVLAMPAMAVFGEKDWQQLAIIRRLVQDLGFPVEIVGRPIVREDDGLAMSSRNVYLTPEERAQAPAIRQGLVLAMDLVQGGELRSAEILANLSAWYREHLPEGQIDYLEIVDPAAIVPVDEIRGGALLAVAVRLGKARLIDNILLEE